jgi:hypothetical protein
MIGKADRQKIIEAYQGRNSEVTVVAKSFGVSRQYVSRIWIEAGFPLGDRPRRTQEELDRYREGRNKRQRQRENISQLDPPNLLLQRVGYRAKRRGISFDLSPEDIVIPTHCPVLGIPLNLSPSLRERDSSPSLDRIDNSRGYIRGNIVVVSYRVNRLKSDAFVWELEKIAKFYRELKMKMS